MSNLNVSQEGKMHSFTVFGSLNFSRSSLWLKFRLLFLDHDDLGKKNICAIKSLYKLNLTGSWPIS